MKRAICRDESGQVLVLVALCITALMGFVALAVDVGILLREKRVLQTAADSAAIAGAAELKFGNMTAGAQGDASQNGVTNGVNGATVIVNDGPSSGPHAGNLAYVEVIASRSVPTFFMRLFNRSSMTVSARAVAAAIPSPSCIDTLGTTAPGISMSGSATLTLPSCGILDGAAGGGALTMGGGTAISATSIGVVGTTSIHIGGVTSPTPVTGIPTVTDPLNSYATPPPVSDYSSGCLPNTTIKTTQTIGPSTPTGYVCYTGLSFPKGSPTVTLNPGLYIFNGSAGLNVASGTTLIGTDVTLYFVNGASFTISNGSTLNLSAPTAGSYSGLLFYQDPTDSAADSFIGGSAGAINGIFYLPSANLTFANGGSSTFSSDLVVNSLTMSGNANVKPYAPLAGASPLAVPRLAE